MINLMIKSTLMFFLCCTDVYAEITSTETAEPIGSNLSVLRKKTDSGSFDLVILN